MLPNISAVRVESPIKFKRTKQEIIADKRFFTICEIKEKESGLIKKEFFYTHFDGKKWEFVTVKPGSPPRRYVIE